MGELLTVGIGGFIGSCLRFLFTKASKCLGLTFPLGTFLSNIIAGFAIGLIAGLEQQSLSLSPKNKLFLTTGILGGLSTFSTFSLETVNFFTDGNYFIAIGNIVLNLGISLVCVVLGMHLAKILLYKA